MVGFNCVGCDHDSSLLQSDIKGIPNPADTFNLTPRLRKNNFLFLFARKNRFVFVFNYPFVKEFTR